MEKELHQDETPRLAPWPWPLFALALTVGVAAGYHYYELYSSLDAPIASERH